MNPLKKKPKPISSMPMTRRMMVLLSLILVLMGCFVLYSAMQNEQWTRDEQTQRKIFLLASLLLITSIALCYYALSGDIEEEKERLESELLTSAKFGNYNSLKPSSTLPSSNHNLAVDMEKNLLKILHPSEKKVGKIRDINFEDEKPNKRLKDEMKRQAVVHKEIFIDRGRGSNDSSNGEKPVKTKSLIVQMMPMLPLQLCEQELDLPKSNFDHRKLINSCHFNNKVPLHREKNSDAG